MLAKMHNPNPSRFWSFGVSAGAERLGHCPLAAALGMAGISVALRIASTTRDMCRSME